MKKHLLLFTLILFMGFTQVGWGQGLEDFTNSNATASYTSNTFTGNNSITWTYVASRNENADANGSGITIPALMLRRVADLSKVTSGTISGGIGDFSVKLYKGFTGAGSRQVELFINGVSKGTSTVFDDYLEHTFSVTGINVSGNIVIEIRNITAYQIIVDNITWTAYSSGGVDNPSSFSASAGSANDIDLSWAQNGNTDDVMVAFNTVDTFGDPTDGVAYAATDAIPGGGTVIYNGSALGYNHSSLTANTTYYYKAWSVDGTTTYSAGVTSNATTAKVEPTNHSTSFASAAGTPDYSAINLTWVDATGGQVPDGYLIKASTTSYVAIADPSDGTAESDATLVQNIAQGTQTASFTQLSASTTYYFKIYPYTNSGTSINYKIDGTIPTTSITTGSAPAASLLFEENFNFVAASDLATQNGWTIIGADATNLNVSSSDLSYSGYPSSGGMAADITASRADDLGNSFTAQSSGIIYYSFLVKVTGLSGAGAYFTGLNTTNTGTNYTGRVYAKIVGSDVNFGLGRSSETATYSGTAYVIGTTYLLVVKYEFVGGTSNDKASLFIFTSPTLPASEPGTADVGPLAPVLADNASLGAVFLRQASGVPDLSIDGIRISNGWSEAPLPVELTSFSASIKNRAISLTWKTATELNNYGFDIERTVDFGAKVSMVSVWEKVGFVNGAGNSNSPKEYSFTDKSAASGKYLYRLKQLDNDGQYTYSKEVEVDLGTPTAFALEQNYPNPFNPTTSMQYSVSNKQFVTIKVFDMLGREVALLVNGEKEPGTYTTEFATTGLASGTYIYRMQAGEFVQTKKMVILK